MLNRNREQWLEAAAREMRPWFEDANAPLPEKVRVSIGFPSKKALSLKSRTIGQCWSGAASSDGVPQVFISPVIAEGTLALAVLVHELIHAAVGCEHGHKAAFGRPARALGLTGKLTVTTTETPNPKLRQQLAELVEVLGDYPHAALNPALSGRKAQKNRQLLAECKPCKYKLRGARATFDRAVPECPLCHERMEVEGGDEPEEEGE
jgi:hypothetical protein